jgi:two-component system response regulator
MSTERTDILLVEDNEFEVILFLRAHRMNGSATKVEVARDGVEALEMLFDGNPVLPRLVLLDLNMPRVDGFEVLERLRADPRTRDLPVVIFSGSDEESDKVKADRLGASAYVRKPIGFAKLQATLAEIERDWLGAQPSTGQ